MNATEDTSQATLHGILAEFRNPKELMNVAEKITGAGYQKFDTYSPFPIHGMEKSMNLPKSKVGWIVLAHGIAGFVGAVSLILYTIYVDYPMNISGKPLLNLPAYVPVTFELTVLLSAFGATFGMFFVNGLPKLNNPLFNVDRFEKATNDGFFACIEADDQLFEEEKVRQLFEDAGATHIEKVYDQ